MGMRIADLVCRSDESSIVHLVGAHAGRPAYVLGGGPSLPHAFEALCVDPDQAVLISANEHGCVLSETTGSRMPDYIVCVDEIQEKLSPYRVPVVAPRTWADVPMFGKPVHQSGMLGCFVAWIMGCAPIVPLGMDLYRGGTYFHAPGAFSTGRKVPFDELLRRWERLLVAIGGDDVIRVPADSPLETWFSVFDPAERVQSAASAPDRAAALEVPRLRMLRAWKTKRGVQLKPGDVVCASRPACGNLIRAKLAELVDSDVR